MSAGPQPGNKRRDKLIGDLFPIFEMHFWTKTKTKKVLGYFVLSDTGFSEVVVMSMLHVCAFKLYSILLHFYVM